MVQPHFPNLSRNYVPMKLSLKTWEYITLIHRIFVIHMKAENAILNNKASKENPQPSDAARNPQSCFNCNDIGHLSKSCPNHSRGPRCLSCNLYGHKSFECRRANLNNTSTSPSGVNAVNELPSPINMCKDVTICGRKLNGLVDTGSNLTLLRNSTYINIDAPPL
ncbi:hypothetical protein TNCV_1992821 [Trichonephila clavipes]|nr:hypothetical protein TNCV_1992821 [Trichonephila clavipes]